MDSSATEPVEIRPARVEDARAISQVHIESWRATYPGIVPQDYIDSLDVDVFTERWGNRLAAHPEMLIYVAEAGQRICGFASGGPARAELAGFSGELYAIYLIPESQSKGIGSRLFWTVADGLQGGGCSGMHVWVLDQNPSKGFYRQMGGRELSSAEIEVGGRCLKKVSYGWSELAVAVEQAQQRLRAVNKSS